MVYGCDGPWWRSRNGLPEFSGLKLAHDTGVCAEYVDLNKIEIIGERDLLLFDEPGVIANGGNSGAQAFNLALQFGARRILLVGFDMQIGKGLHWYGRNGWKRANNPQETNCMRWRDAFEANVPLLARRGIDVINASASSALTCFRHLPIEAALQEWGL